MPGPRRPLRRLALAGLLVAGGVLAPRTSPAHPLGNFSVSHYAGICVERGGVALRYLIDMAEIPTFQELQNAGIVPQAGHPGLDEYLARKAETWKQGLVLALDGRRLRLAYRSSEVLFPPGAGGLRTMKVGVLYYAAFDEEASPDLARLEYRDDNFRDRAGWKEVVATGATGITIVSSSVPETDRSRELADYPTDLLNSPPQDLAARVAFTRTGASPGRGASTGVRRGEEPLLGGRRPAAERPVEAVGLQPNRRGTPRDAFTELIATRLLDVRVVAIALLMAAGLGALHALEPGHGKTVVAAYLVGSRGTAGHALLLGLIVTASHTAGVYLLGGLTLYASRYVMPERLYPWLGALSGLVIAGLGIYLFRQRWAGAAPHAHPHPQGPHSHPHGRSHPHGPHQAHPAHAPHESPGAAEAVHHVHEHDADPGHAPNRLSLRGLFTLGISGGIVPCPAALVVLLGALALGRVGFGLLLIVAFSVGLAAVLIGIGLLLVWARRLMGRVQGEGRLVTQWLPLLSSAVITVVGALVTVQALVAAGILRGRL